ncbi:MAG: DNA adenine methylase [Terriglobales bacterium]
MSVGIAAYDPAAQLGLWLPDLPKARQFPETKYMGSKQGLLPFIMGHLSKLKIGKVLDAFSGSACVSYGLKELGSEVHANDFLRFAFHVSRATIQNNSTCLSHQDIAFLLKKNPGSETFIQDTFGSLYFDFEDNKFLDNLWANIQDLKSPIKRSLALAAACRAAMKKRPRGIFTFTGKKGWDSRLDLRLSMEQQFLSAAQRFNAAVFSNGKPNQAFCDDVFDLDPRGYDCVYIDTPYVSPFSDCDYTRRYHFVEGFCSYWKDREINFRTTTKKIPSYSTDFSTKANAVDAFSRLFEHFRHSILAVSYSSNCVPSKEQMVCLLKHVKRSVQVREISHRYSHGNHNHKVGDNNNDVKEYLFIAI